MTETNQGEARVPVVVVDDLHVKYRVFASGKAAGAARSGLLNMTRGIREVHALKGVSFTAYENETIGVIGSNGSGKSTLMRALTGLTPPAAGAVYARSRPNLLGVGAALLPNLSGSRNIVLGGLAMGFSRDEVDNSRPTSPSSPNSGNRSTCRCGRTPRACRQGSSSRSRQPAATTS